MVAMAVIPPLTRSSKKRKNREKKKICKNKNDKGVEWVCNCVKSLWQGVVRVGRGALARGGQMSVAFCNKGTTVSLGRQENHL